MVETIYLHVLSRFPTEDERLVLSNYFSDTNATTRALAADLVWVLVNQPEFYYIH
jgi:hypothetical protein